MTQEQSDKSGREALALLAEAQKELEYSADAGAEHEVYLAGARSVALSIKKFLATASLPESRARSVEQAERESRINGDRAALEVIDGQKHRIVQLEEMVAFREAELGRRVKECLETVKDEITKRERAEAELATIRSARPERTQGDTEDSITRRLRQQREDAANVVMGWREVDWPEGFDRRTAELVAQWAAGAVRGLDGPLPVRSTRQPINNDLTRAIDKMHDAVLDSDASGRPTGNLFEVWWNLKAKIEEAVVALSAIGLKS